MKRLAALLIVALTLSGCAAVQETVDNVKSAAETFKSGAEALAALQDICQQAQGSSDSTLSADETRTHLQWAVTEGLKLAEMLPEDSGQKEITSVLEAAQESLSDELVNPDDVRGSLAAVCGAPEAAK